MLQFTVPLYSHKKTQIIAYYADGTQTLAQVYVLYWSYSQTEMSQHQSCSLQRARAVVEDWKMEKVCDFVLSSWLKLVPLQKNYPLLHVQHIQTCIPPLPLGQTNITFITSVFLNVNWFVWPIWVCNIAETLSWKTCRHQSLTLGDLWNEQSAQSVSPWIS